MKLLRHAQYPAISWKDGQGTACDIAHYPQESLWNMQFIWRLALADITQNCDFSTFDGYDRTFAIVEGAGVFLEHEDNAQHAVDTLFSPVQFASERKTACTLLGGQALAFNMLVRRDAARAASATHTIEAGTPLALPMGNGARTVVCFSGDASITHTTTGTVALGTLDTLLLDDAPALSISSDTGAEIFVADITLL
jgi:uncharacterized protein